MFAPASTRETSRVLTSLSAVIRRLPMACLALFFDCFRPGSDWVGQILDLFELLPILKIRSTIYEFDPGHLACFDGFPGPEAADAEGIQLPGLNLSPILWA